MTKCICSHEWIGHFEAGQCLSCNCRYFMIPPDPSSLSSVVGHVAAKARSDEDWKRDTFPQETQ